MRKKGRGNPMADVIMAFVKSWEIHGTDETTIYSRTLDVIRAYVGDRPCCIWKKGDGSLVKMSERGMVEMYYTHDENRQAALNRSLVSGSIDFDAIPTGMVVAGSKDQFDGFAHIPIKYQEDIHGLLSLAVRKKESRDLNFIQPLECLCRLMAISVRESLDREVNSTRELRLRSEVEATTHELEQTNRKLIERVKELKALYNELQDRVKELTIANKSKDEFLSIVSHELRTPLTSLNGFLSVMLEEEAGPLTDAQRKFLKISKQSADRLNLLISDLLDISRIESGRMTLDMADCSLFDILHRSVEGLKSMAAAKNIQLRFQSVPTLPPVWGDASRLQQVIDNLIANAIKFSSEEGHVDIETQDRGDVIQVSVRDDGPGLKEEDRKKIFDMFYQADQSMRRKAGGVGLGLSIARGIIVLHGGQIWVESEKPKGSTFKFVVPRRKERKVA